MYKMKQEDDTIEQENSVLQAIKARRSVRHYKTDPVPRKLIEKIIEAGNWAPSVGNLQPWRFVVIEDEKLRMKLKEMALPKWRKTTEKLKEDDPQRYRIHARHLGRDDPVYYSAPVIIFIIGPSGINSALACENMMLAAHSLGLGSCYVGWGALVIYEPELIEALELKEKESVFGPIIIGYPEKYPEPPPKKEAKIKWI
jgi:nitroreductase